jgi:hypothetical protein
MEQSLTPRQRELELVTLMLEDRTQFYAQYRRIMGLEPTTPLEICNREIVHRILAVEYPDQVSERTDAHFHLN